MVRKSVVVAACFGLTAWIGSAQAAVVTGNIVRTANTDAAAGSLVVLEPSASNPITVGANQINDPNLYAINEGQDVVLTDPLSVLGADGLYTELAARTIVDSHYLEYDPSNAGRGRAEITVTFDRQILGVIILTQALIESDAIFGAENVTYGANRYRGVEQPGDTISVTGNSIRLDVYARAPDGFRVLTASAPSPVPLPAAAWFMAMGIAGLHRAYRPSA